jgi:hypothetical protein
MFAARRQDATAKACGNEAFIVGTLGNWASLSFPAEIALRTLIFLLLTLHGDYLQAYSIISLVP